MPVYNFTDGSTDKAFSWWMFEESASPSVDGNTTNAQNLTWTTASQDTTSGHFMQGSSGLKATGNEATTNPIRTHANLSASFPFKGATTGYTIGGWIYAASWVNDDVVQRYAGAASTTGYSFSVSGTGKIGHSLFSINNVDSDANIPAGRNHIVGRWNGANRAGAGADDEVSLWVNGVKQTATFTTASVNLVTDGSGFWFYSYPAQQPTFDEWAVFDVALTDEQIASWYTNGLAGERGTTTESRRIFIVRAG